MYGSTGSHPHNRINQYIVKEILEASPQQLLIKIYDFAILNCQRHDLSKTNNAIQELINSLNFEDESAREISTGLLRLYQFCQDQMRKREYDVVYKILTELRDTWKNAFNM
ncbi:MAG: flagellar protein FliS [Melioribacteraceae bacterium]|nr:flagellar protein FliS [Melioribacteraceae bacterium]